MVDGGPAMGRWSAGLRLWRGAPIEHSVSLIRIPYGTSTLSRICGSAHEAAFFDLRCRGRAPSADLHRAARSIEQKHDQAREDGEHRCDGGAQW